MSYYGALARGSDVADQPSPNRSSVYLPFCGAVQSQSGQLPVEVSSVEFLGNVKSNNTYVNRDLGFHGKIGNLMLLSYGDTMWSDSSYSETFRGMTSDSAAFATSNPLIVQDFNLNASGYPQQFCPLLDEYGEDPSVDALGITNVVETSPGQGNGRLPSKSSSD